MWARQNLNKLREADKNISRVGVPQSCGLRPQSTDPPYFYRKGYIPPLKNPTLVLTPPNATNMKFFFFKICQTFAKIGPFLKTFALTPPEKRSFLKKFALTPPEKGPFKKMITLTPPKKRPFFEQFAMSPPSFINISEIYVDPPKISKKLLGPPLKIFYLVCTPPKKAEIEAYPP